MISFMAQDEKEEKEQDEIETGYLVQIKNAMDEINTIVTKHVKSARAKRFGIFKCSTASEVVQQHHQQQQVASAAQPVQQMPPPPPLHNIGEFFGTRQV